MCAAKNENIISFLNRHEMILWQPIELMYKDPNKPEDGKKEPMWNIGKGK